MIPALASIVFLYLAIKLCHLVMAPSTGFDRTERPFKERLRDGEPILIIGTVLICALVFGFGHWWSRRFAEGQYVYSTDCYAKLSASYLLPARPAKFGASGAAQTTSHYANFARMHGAQLGMSGDVIDAALEKGKAAQAERYSKIAAGQTSAGAPAAIKELARCLNGDDSPKGELLRPVL
jgi:hypothetical protein